ncbi:hypothetical protein TNCV_78891 [Trichonephila clavipes]|nr:hypothetical protein TNCV_78891 [Trichonephila clavipes]
MLHGISSFLSFKSESDWIPEFFHLQHLSTTLRLLNCLPCVKITQQNRWISRKRWRYRNLDGNRCRRPSEFQLLNDDEIVTFVQAESDHVDEEADEDDYNYNESSKGPSNAGVFSALETAME